MTEKLSECCGAEVKKYSEEQKKSRIWAGKYYLDYFCTACNQPCSVAIKPDERLLTDDELYEVYVKAVSAEDVCKHVYYEQCHADTLKRIKAVKDLIYPLAFEAGKKQGARELAEWAITVCKNKSHPAKGNTRIACMTCWQAKMKELGL